MESASFCYKVQTLLSNLSKKKVTKFPCQHSKSKDKLRYLTFHSKQCIHMNMSAHMHICMIINQYYKVLLLLLYVVFGWNKNLQMLSQNMECPLYLCHWKSNESSHNHVLEKVFPNVKKMYIYSMILCFPSKNKQKTCNQ